MRVAIYSIDSISLDATAQHDLLNTYAEKNNYRVIKHFSEVKLTQKSISSLIAINALLKGAKAGDFQHVLVQDLALFGASLTHMVGLIRTLQSYSVGITFLKQNLSTTGDQGEVLVKVIEAMWNYDKQSLSSRIKLGQRNAVASGKKLGRPSLNNDGMKAAMIALRKTGMGMRNLAHTTGLGVGTCYSILREAEAI